MEDVCPEFDEGLDGVEAGVTDGVLQHAPTVLVVRSEEASLLHNEPKTKWAYKYADTNISAQSSTGSTKRQAPGCVNDA